MKKDKMKKKMMGYKAGGLQMVEKDGKKVPFYAADGKGKMMGGGKVMGYKHGGAHLTTSSTTARSGPTPNAEGLKREAEVSNELDADMAAFKKRAAARKAKKAGKKMMSGGKVMGYKEGKTVKKKSEVKTKRGGRFDSSKELGAGFDERLPSALVEEDFKKGIMGKYSPRAAIQGAISSGIDLFRSKEGKRGSGIAKKVAKKKAGKMAGGMMKKKMMGGGKVMGYKKGGMPRGCGVATRQRPAKMVVMRGS